MIHVKMVRTYLKIKGKCVAVNPNETGYTEAIVDSCSKIKSRLKYYSEKLGEKNTSKKVYKLGKRIKWLT